MTIRFTKIQLLLIIATLDTFEYKTATERVIANQIIDKIYKKIESEEKKND